MWGRWQKDGVDQRREDTERSWPLSTWIVNPAAASGRVGLGHPAGLFQATGQQQPHLAVFGVADDEVVEPVDSEVETSLFLQDAGETLDVNATVRVDPASGLQMCDGLVHQPGFAGLS